MNTYNVKNLIYKYYKTETFYRILYKIKYLFVHHFSAILSFRFEESLRSAGAWYSVLFGLWDSTDLRVFTLADLVSV